MQKLPADERDVMARGITKLRELIAALLEEGADLDDEVAVMDTEDDCVHPDALEIRSESQGGGRMRWIIYVP